MPQNTVYAADDDVLITEVLELHLGAEGYDVTSIATAADTLALVRRRPPALLILDLNLQDGNGLDVLRALRRDVSFNGVQVLMLSGEDDPAVADHARALGAGGYLLKPFGARRLIAETRRLIGPALGANAKLMPAAKPSPASLNPVLAGLVDSYGTQTVNRLLTALSRALLNLERDAPPSQTHLEQAAHALKGAAGTLGFTLVSSTCSALERACQEGHTLDLPLSEAVGACVRARYDIERHLQAA
jgi:DNA-binding response OmpR family regulator